MILVANDQSFRQSLLWLERLDSLEKQLPQDFVFARIYVNTHHRGLHHQIDWLQERFPEGIYEDVTGLCKLATLEEIQEQDYSLNPGRYVGVVIEEDGMTEDEFTEDILTLHQHLQGLYTKAQGLQQRIDSNLKSFLEN